MAQTPCLDECNNAAQQAEFFSSPADTCKFGSKFLLAYSSCAQCAIKLEAQPTRAMPNNLEPILSYCRMEIQYASIETLSTDSKGSVKTNYLYSITDIPAEPTAQITGSPPTTVLTAPTSATIQTSSFEDWLPTKIPNPSQTTRTVDLDYGDAKSNMVWVIGPVLGLVALLAIILLLWLYIRRLKQHGAVSSDPEWIKRQPPRKSRLPLKPCIKPTRKSSSSIRRFLHIHELPGSTALPQELPGSTSLPQELRGSSPRPKSTRNLHGKNPEDVEVLEAAYVAAKMSAADQLKEMREIAPRQRSRPRRKGSRRARKIMFKGQGPNRRLSI